ncbi:unnamed protein product [Albugo candida]|uniref:SANT domain-containing protein n=1 Tax=Albugo candida TaxID=65357 RepID=A0A024GRD5_9STRA|nr:unnamed protein product [Albugo candida]|eukprot:CCI49438.1 unnamed protein product [Albugo candida]
MLSRSARSTSQGRQRDDKAAEVRNVKLHNFRQYLQSAHNLYCHPKAHTEIDAKFTQHFCQPRRIACDTVSSELRVVQFFENWTYLEIGIFEECVERFGKCFHKIAREIPRKSVKDVISFYYLWKKCTSRTIGRKKDAGRCAQKEQSDHENMDSAMRSNIDRYKGSQNVTLFRDSGLQKLQFTSVARQRLLKEYFCASRSLYGPKSDLQPLSKRLDLKSLRLDRVGAYRACIQGNAQLRSSNVFDSWSPLDIYLFTQGIQHYGKRFHLVARKIGTKTCKQVIAFYYQWKKEAYSSF